MSFAAHLTLNDFAILKVIGRGGMGKVMLVRHRGSGQLYALKSVHKQWVLAFNQLAHAQSERAILARFRESFNVAPTGAAGRGRLDCFLVRMHATFQSATELFYVLDFHAGGDLAAVLGQQVRLGEGAARFYAAEIVTGLQLLHQRHVIYRDLKPENVLLDVEGHVVLTDFGLSTWTAAGGEGGGQGRTVCGTAEYLAPEIVLGQACGPGVDLWSLGVMLYEMLVGAPPFWHESPPALYQLIVRARVECPVFVSGVARDLVLRLLVRVPEQRPSLQQIRQHPFFAGVDWRAVEARALPAPFRPVLPDVTAAFGAEFTSLPAQITPVDAETMRWLASPKQQEPFSGFSYYPEQ